MTGQDVDDYARTLLLDASAVHWVAADFLRWINAGTRDIATYKPQATTTRGQITLAANVTKQAVPADTIAVLSLDVNMGTDGATPGRQITTVTADRLAAARPGWRADKGDVVKHLVQDDRERDSFMVWPAPKTAIKVEGLLQKHAAPITALAQTLPIDDSYLNALGEFVVHMAYAQEGEDMNIELSSAHYAKYAQTLGIQIKQQKRAKAPANSAESPAYPAVDKNGA